MKRHSHSQKKTKDSVFVPQIQSQLQSRAWPEPTEPLNPDLESPDLQAEPEPGAGFEFNLANIPISAPTATAEEANPSQIQTKGLTIGAPGDKYEQEADAVARKVVSEINQPPQTQGQAEAETEEVIQPKLAPSPFLRRKSDIQREENIAHEIAQELTPVVQQSGAANIQCKLTPDQIKHANRIRKARGLPLLPVEQAQTANNIEEAVPDVTVENEPIEQLEQQNSIENEPSHQQSIESQLLNGIISIEELREFLPSTSKNAIESLDPQSYLIRNILKYPLGQSWHTAKHELAEGDEKAKALMRKIWEFRQWHHKEILERTKERVNRETGDSKGLDKFPAAGSETLTSDIDVNLKGTQTELAVKVFNEEFKKDGWDYEAGVVYDVNVYALDFMHKFGGVDVDGHQLTKKEGEREGQAQGGFKERILSEQDKEQQDEWSLVKVRLYISNPVQWEEYAEAAGLSKQKKDRIEAKYQNYIREISEEMSNQAGITLDDEYNEDDMASGISGLNSQAENLIDKQHGGKLSSSEVLAENLLIGSSNRVYERKLEELSKLRQELKEAIARYNEMVEKPDNNNQGTSLSAVTALNGYIEVKLKALRKVVSECALFSNEAYVTDAAVYHAVVGLQGGKAIEQTKAESMQAVTENMGDALKEISRHNDTLGEAAFKSGKYIWRMADAAKNMGFSRIPGVNDLYEVGFTIANEIKGQEEIDEQQQASAEQMNQIGIETGSQLVAKILIVGTAIRREYTQLTKGQQSSLSQPTPDGKKVRNTN
jgi:predicted RNA-binding protein Jag